MNILAIDPGLRMCGVGDLYDGLIMDATLVLNPEEKERGAYAWRAMGRAVREWWSRQSDTEPDLLVIERMYLGRATADTMFQLVGVTGAIAALFDCPRIITPLPSEWKGQTPKEIHNQRVLTRIAGLPYSPMDGYHGANDILEHIKSLGAKRHNAIDAAGIALWAWDHYR